MVQSVNDVIDDFDFNELPPQEAPTPIKGKVKKNIQRWIFAAVLLIAAPIAIWQGIKEEQAGQEEWKVKEQERAASQARGTQAGDDTVKEIAVIATQQKQQVAEAASVAASAPTAPTGVAAGGSPLPIPPEGVPEEMPIVPLSVNQASKKGAPVVDDTTVIATSGILLLSGGIKQTNDAAQKIGNTYGQGATNMLPGMVMPQQSDPNEATANIVNAIKGSQPRTPITRAEAAQQWMKDQQKNEATDSDGLYARPAHNDTVIMEGTMLDAAFLTAVNTDLPGDVTAIITRDVYDSMEPERYLLIPKGSKLIGSYNSDVNIGQERIMMAFKRLIFPDGSSINLLGMSGSDTMGRSGLVGDVDNHFLKMFGASFLIAGVSKLVTPKQPVNVNVYGQGGGQLITETGAILTDISGRILRRNENVPPTITIPAGDRFNVRVNKDMHLPPYKVR